MIPKLIRTEFGWALQTDRVSTAYSSIGMDYEGRKYETIVYDEGPDIVERYWHWWQALAGHVRWSLR